MATFPVTLPQTPLIQDNLEVLPDMVIRSPMEVGPPKFRKRATTAFRAMTYVFNMTTAQTQTLDTFFETTCNGGATSFDWTNPRTGSTDEFYFVAPPEYEALGADYFKVSLALIKVP